MCLLTEFYTTILFVCKSRGKLIGGERVCVSSSDIRVLGFHLSKIPIVWPFSGGLLKIVAKLLTSYVWSQKFTWNNPMEHLLDLFKFFWEAFEGQGSQFSLFFYGFSLKRQSALGTLRGSDTVNSCQASTLRSKGIHRHPYCRVLSLKRPSGLVTFGDLWRVLGGPDTVRDHQGLTLRSKGTI